MVPGRAADPGSAHPDLVLDVFNSIPGFSFNLLRLAGEAISLVASDLANRFLGLALEVLGASFDASGGGGKGQGGGAEGEGS